MSILQEANKQNSDLSRMKARSELLKMLAEAEEDVKSEKLAPVSETFDKLKKLLYMT